jgi:hypothetical protein
MGRSSEVISYIVSKQGEQMGNEPSGGYLEPLVRIVSSAPESTPLFSSLLNYEKVQNFHLKALFNQINRALENSSMNQDLLRLIDEHATLGLSVASNKLALLPANSNRLPVDPAILIHRGHVLIETAASNYDNRDNLSQVGVFGSPDFGVPTYLQSHNSQEVSPNVDPRARKSQKVCIYLDADKLVKYRSLYPDPEGLLKTSELGNSFFVLGGIPAAAIIALSRTPHDPVMVVPR